MSRKELAQMYRTHLGKIFFNLSIAGLVSMFLIGVAPIVLVFVAWFMMIIIGMLSLFILFLNEDYMALFNSMSELLNGLGFEKLAPIIIGLGAVAIVGSILSVLIFATNKDRAQKGRIGSSILVLCLAIITLVVILILRGGGAQ